MLHNFQGVLIVLLLQEHLDPPDPDIDIILDHFVVHSGCLVQNFIALPQLTELLVDFR